MAEEEYKRPASRWVTSCMYCGAMFSKKPGGPLRKLGRLQRCCTKQCDTDMRRKVGCEVEAIRRIARNNTPRLRPKSAILKTLVCRLADVIKIRQRQLLASRPCSHCGKAVGYSGGRPRLFCSSSCLRSDMKRRPECIESDKAQRKRRKAIQRGAKVGAPFTYKQVFDRDGWRCQMCGVNTPERLRGTYKKNAPELDHIVPLSKGGEHSYTNTRCLCRSCNAWKSDRIIPSQTGLFTGFV